MRAVALLLLSSLALAHPADEATLWVDIYVHTRGVEMVVGIRADLAAPWLHGTMMPEELVDDITPEESQRARDALTAYFGKHNALLIDDQRVVPICERIETPEDARGRMLIDYLAFRLVYPHSSPQKGGWPRKVSIIWEDFEMAKFMDEPTIPGTFRVGPQVETLALGPDDPKWTWAYPDVELPQQKALESIAANSRHVPVPWAAHIVLGSAACLGFFGLLRARASGGAWLLVLLLLGGSAAALPWKARVYPPVISELQARTVFEALHQNIYAAFEGVTESDIYDLLAISVEPELIDRLYLQVLQGLVMSDQGGAIAEVGKIERRGSEIEFPAPGEFRVRWRWRVYAHVTHWGHTHARINEYVANFVVHARGSHWRIADYEVLEAERIPTLDEEVPPR